MSFANPIVAGIVLVIPAIQSPNYVTGVSGWTIKQDGSVEFNNATIRGNLIAGGGAVTVDSGGVTVVGSTQTTELLPEIGIISADNTDGGVIQMFSVHGQGGTLFLYPDKGVNNVTWTPGEIIATDTTTGTSDAGRLWIFAPIDNVAHALCQIFMDSGSTAAPTASHIDLQANSVTAFNDFSAQGNLKAGNFAQFNTFTPSWAAGFTIGGGAINEGWYQLIGGFVIWGFRVEAGTSPAFTTSLLLNLPLAAYTGASGGQLAAAVGEWGMRSASGANYGGPIVTNDTGGTQVRFTGAWNGTAPLGNIGSTTSTPATPVAGNVLSGSGSYRAR